MTHRHLLYGDLQPRSKSKSTIKASEIGPSQQSKDKFLKFGNPQSMSIEKPLLSQRTRFERDSYSKVKARFWRVKTLTAVADLPTVSAYMSPPCNSSYPCFYIFLEYMVLEGPVQVCSGECDHIL